MTSDASVPSHQSGLIIEKTGGPEVLQWKADIPVPQLGEGEVLIKNDYIGVNFIDTYFRTGLYPLPKGFPHTLGVESSGTIVSLGSGENYGLKVGDRVVSLSRAAYAQYSIGPALHTFKLPEGVETRVAAAAWIQGLTALTLVRESYEVKRGDWILVHAAAGGTGLWLLQLLRGIGAKVIATCSTSKIELARSHGAEIVHDYTKEGALEDLIKVVKEATGGKGVACVYDGVGKATFDTSLECLARKGSLISFGNASGKPDPLVIARLSPKSLKLMRPTVFTYIVERKEFEHYSEELAGFLKKGIDVRIHDVYPLKEAARAHEDLEGRKTTGKLLLQP